jgi:ATP/maltotriose-dependent transcriptional regulator MalT
VTRRLLEALNHRLAIVRAGTGYGKSTALAALADREYPLAWYHLDAQDADSLVFLLHLLYSFRIALPDMSERALAALEGWQGAASLPGHGSSLPWKTVLGILVNELVECGSGPMLLVIDDVHLLNQTSEPLRILDWLVGRAPPHLHVLLSTRYPPRLPNAVTWRVRGELLEIGQKELAFTPAEVASLFRDQYRVFLTPQEVDELATKTEGWAIALQLVWQGLRTGLASTLPQALRRLSGSDKAAALPEDFFAFLAQEVLEQQPPDIQEFLLMTAVLREMTAPICDCLRNANDGFASHPFVAEQETGHNRSGSTRQREPQAGAQGGLPTVMPQAAIASSILRLTREPKRESHPSGGARRRVIHPVQTGDEMRFAQSKEKTYASYQSCVPYHRRGCRHRPGDGLSVS